MQNKNPQGNFDPLPDSDQELEKYGVWVKAEPQDLVEELETDHRPLVFESGSSLETMEELSDEIEELEEMQALDEANTVSFEDLSPLDDSEPSMMDIDSEEPESIDLSDFGLDEFENATEAEQSFEDIDMELDLDEALSADSISDDDTGDLLPQIDMEDIDMAEDSQTPTFDDLSALEEDLVSGSPSRDQETVSGDLLQKIALELSSIKEELVSLRSQLGELKRAPAPSGIEEEEAEADSSKGGFFDDEDDDTIALTGDELDNILNTADFTVEPPEDLTTPENLDETDIFEVSEIPGNPEIAWDAEAQDLLPEDGSYLSTEFSEASPAEETGSTLEPGIEAIEGDRILDLDFETEEEQSLLEIIPEVNVITESLEDTSYLDEDSAEVSDGFELDASPLEEVPLMEPDPTELDLGIEIDDAMAAESAEDLPFMESADEDESELLFDEESGSVSLASDEDESEIEDDNFDSILDLEEADDEMVLSIDGDEQTDSFGSDDFPESTMDEVEDAEPLSMDPFEDEVFSELELHKEETRPQDGKRLMEHGTIAHNVSAEEISKLESPVLDETFETSIGDFVEDLETMDFEDTGLLGSQEVEDLGGEVLDNLGEEELENLGDEEMESLSGEELETLDDEVLEGLGDASEADTMDDFEEMEELTESEDLDVDVETIIDEPELAEEELQVEAPDTEEPVPDKLKQDVKSVLLYLDQLLASLPEEKIEEFASSEYYDTYKKLFEDLGLL